VEVLSVAMDAQGAERARPYVDKARATFVTVVDEENMLGQLYGFRAIPNGFLIDEQGVVRYKKLGGFDVRKAETSSVVQRWAAGSDLSESAVGHDTQSGSELSESNALLRQGLELYRKGDVAEAIALWRKGVELDPANYILRKQVWAVENPDKFYSGDIDYIWQKEQTEKGL
jgi:hypothetical protein